MCAVKDINKVLWKVSGVGFIIILTGRGYDEQKFGKVFEGCGVRTEM